MDALVTLNDTIYADVNKLQAEQSRIVQQIQVLALCATCCAGICVLVSAHGCCCVLILQSSVLRTAAVLLYLPEGHLCPDLLLALVDTGQ